MSERPELSVPDLDRLRTIYRDASLRASPVGSHPSEDDWVRLAGDELPADEQAALADHLVSCADCRDTYRVVMEVLGQAASVDPAGRGFVAPADVPREAATPVAPATWTWRDLALAATLLMAVGTGVWAWSLRSRVGTLQDQLASTRSGEQIAGLEAAVRQAEQRAAQLERDLVERQQAGVNAPLVDLEPDVVRGDRSKPTEVVVPSGARYLTLVFTFTVGTAPNSPFTAEIVSDAGTRVGAWPGIAPGAFQTTTMVVPSGLVPAGAYTVRLLDASGAPMQSHRLIIR